MTDQHDQAAPTDRTADDLWWWLLRCLDCDNVHTYRREAGRRPWASPDDGHPYRMSHDLNAYRLHLLRGKWDREGR